MSEMFPQIGDKIKYVGPTYFWSNIFIENGTKYLTIGNIYTISSIDKKSPWVPVTLLETGEIEYSLMFFVSDETN